MDIALAIIGIIILGGLFTFDIAKTICDYKLKKKNKIEKEKHDADK